MIISMLSTATFHPTFEPPSLFEQVCCDGHSKLCPWRENPVPSSYDPSIHACFPGLATCFAPASLLSFFDLACVREVCVTPRKILFNLISPGQLAASSFCVCISRIVLLAKMFCTSDARNPEFVPKFCVDAGLSRSQGPTSGR